MNEGKILLVRRNHSRNHNFKIDILGIKDVMKQAV